MLTLQIADSFSVTTWNKKISNLSLTPTEVLSKVEFMADKIEKMNTAHVSVPNSSVQPTK